MIGIIQNPKSNVKKEYTSAHGTFFVHAVTIEGVEYESHQKTNVNKYKGGETVEYEVKQDQKGNKKVSTKPVEAPAASTSTPISSVTPVPSGSHAAFNQVWLQVFAALCTLKAGTPTTLEQVTEKTQEITKKLLS